MARQIRQTNPGVNAESRVAPDGLRLLAAAGRTSAEIPNAKGARIGPLNSFLGDPGAGLPAL